MDAILDIVLVLTGMGLVRLFSLGRWRGEALDGRESRIHAAAGALSFVLEGQRVVTIGGMTLAGMAFYGALLAMVILFAAS